MREAVVKVALLLALLFALGASFWLGGIVARRWGLEPVGGPDTVFVERWIRDTVLEFVSVPGGTVTVYLPVHDTVPVQVRDTVRQVDSVLVDVPIEERIFTGENFRATVRGFRPELADIWIRQKETTITVPYRRRWSLTVGPQAGFGITPEGWQPYAGVGATFGYSF